VQPAVGPTVGVTPRSVPAGQDITVFGSGFPARTPLDVLLFSSPLLLGSTVTDALGSFRVTVTVPADTPLGDHRVVVVSSADLVGRVLSLLPLRLPFVLQAETVLTVTSPLVPAPVTTLSAPRAPLPRTGSDLALPGRLAGGLLVVGLLMVSGPGSSHVRRFRARIALQQPWTR